MPTAATIDDMIAKKAARHEQAWARYIRIINTAETGAKTEAELNDCIESLGLDALRVKDHLAIIDRARKLAERVGELPAAVAAVREAMQKFTDEQTRILRMRSALDADETAIRAFAENAQNKMTALREAESELAKLRSEFDFLFDAGVAAPCTPTGRQRLENELAAIVQQLDARRGRGDRTEQFRLEREQNRLRAKLRQA